MTIHDLVRNGDVDGIKHFIATGGNINEVDKLKRTSLHMAAWTGNFEVFQILVRANAKMDLKAMDDFTVLHFAAQSSNPEASYCIKLISQKAKHLLNYRVSKGQKTALQLAASKGNLNTVRALLESGCDRCTKTSTGQTAAELATTEEVRELILNFDPTTNRLNESDEDGEIDLAVADTFDQAQSVGEAAVGCVPASIEESDHLISNAELGTKRKRIE